MSVCVACQTLECDLVEASAKNRALLHEVGRLRHRASVAEEALTSYKAVHSLSLVAEHEVETPIGLLPLVVHAMAIMSESQAHQLTFEQVEWARRRDVVLKALKALIEGEQ